MAEPIRDLSMSLAWLVDDDAIGELELHRQCRPQWPGRHDAAIADAAAPVNNGDAEILGQRRILQAVVHDDDGGRIGSALDGLRTEAAVAGDQRWHQTREQQRLITDLAGAIDPRIDPVGTRQATAVAARQRNRLMPGGLERFA